MILRRVTASASASKTGRRLASCKKGGRIIFFSLVNVPDPFLTHGRHARNAITMAAHALAELFGLTSEEEDYIVNYDIKYRMGQGSGD